MSTNNAWRRRCRAALSLFLILTTAGALGAADAWPYGREAPGEGSTHRNGAPEPPPVGGGVIFHAAGTGLLVNGWPALPGTTTSLTGQDTIEGPGGARGRVSCAGGGSGELLSGADLIELSAFDPDADPLPQLPPGPDIPQLFQIAVSFGGGLMEGCLDPRPGEGTLELALTTGAVTLDELHTSAAFEAATPHVRVLPDAGARFSLAVADGQSLVVTRSRGVFVELPDGSPDFRLDASFQALFDAAGLVAVGKSAQLFQTGFER